MKDYELIDPAGDDILPNRRYLQPDGTPVEPKQGGGPPPLLPGPASSASPAKKAGSGCLIALGVLVVLGVFGNLLKQREEKEVSSAGRGGGSAPVQSVSISTLLGQYEGNEVRADSLFKGRIVEFSGLVDDVKKDILGSIYVTVGTGQQFEIPQAQCFFSKSHESEVARLNRGARVTVRGRVKGLLMNVLIEDCVLL